MGNINRWERNIWKKKKLHVHTCHSFSGYIILYWWQDYLLGKPIRGIFVSMKTFFFMAPPTAYRISWARDWIPAVAVATLDPLIHCPGLGIEPAPLQRPVPSQRPGLEQLDLNLLHHSGSSYLALSIQRCSVCVFSAMGRNRPQGSLGGAQNCARHLANSVTPDSSGF